MTVIFSGQTCTPKLKSVHFFLWPGEWDGHTHTDTHTDNVKTITPSADVGCKKRSTLTIRHWCAPIFHYEMLLVDLDRCDFSPLTDRQTCGRQTVTDRQKQTAMNTTSPPYMSKGCMHYRWAEQQSNTFHYSRNINSNVHNRCNYKCWLLPVLKRELGELIAIYNDAWVWQTIGIGLFKQWLTSDKSFYWFPYLCSYFKFLVNNGFEIIVYRETLSLRAIHKFYNA